MSTKEAVIQWIRRMPEGVTVPDIIAELYVRQKIDEALRQLDAGQGVDHEEACTMARLIWSPQAAQDLKEICEYLGRTSERSVQIFAQRVVPFWWSRSPTSSRRPHRSRG